MIKTKSEGSLQKILLLGGWVPPFSAKKKSLENWPAYFFLLTGLSKTALMECCETVSDNVHHSSTVKMYLCQIQNSFRSRVKVLTQLQLFTSLMSDICRMPIINSPCHQVCASCMPRVPLTEHFLVVSLFLTVPFSWRLVDDRLTLKCALDDLEI